MKFTGSSLRQELNAGAFTLNSNTSLPPKAATFSTLVFSLSQNQPSESRSSISPSLRAAPDGLNTLTLYVTSSPGLYQTSE